MTYGKMECVKTLQELAERLGRSPQVKDYNEHNCSPSVKTLSNKFGSWNEAKQAAGLDVTKHGYNDNTEAAISALRKKPPKLQHKNGYEFFRVSVYGERKRLYHHRLLAVSKFGFDALDGMHVHHKNGIKWDNRPENIEVLTPSEHMRKHHCSD